MNKNEISIVWFRQDLRLTDPALYHAAHESTFLILLYIDDTSNFQWHLGAASRWWLRESLIKLSQDLEKKFKAPFILKRGTALNVLQTLIKESGATRIYWNRCYAPEIIDRDKNIKLALEKQGIEVKSYNGYLLKEPWEIHNQAGKPFKVFTPFWKKLKTLPLRSLFPTNFKIKSINNLSSDAIDELYSLPTIPWYQSIAKTWQTGEHAAKKLLTTFLTDNIKGYKELRNYPALSHTSRLSPYLHFGEISPLQVWYATQFKQDQSPSLTEDSEHFLSELAWREFSYHLLYYFPTLPHYPFNSAFAHFPWQKNEKLLKAWQQGQTGFPIIDAGMRQLWQTGWMHNRVRMIVASFLIKDLFISWQAGEAWFWDTLVDADLANNAASWQWVAGSGADAAPYFRIFNPTLQSKKFDANGKYIKKWIPELKKLPIKYLHEPICAPLEILKAAKIELGKTYPYPIVDHQKAREAALTAYKKLPKTKD